VPSSDSTPSSERNSASTSPLGEEAAAALLRSLGFEKVTVVFEQPPTT